MVLCGCTFIYWFMLLMSSIDCASRPLGWPSAVKFVSDHYFDQPFILFLNYLTPDIVGKRSLQVFKEEPEIPSALEMLNINWSLMYADWNYVSSLDLGMVQKLGIDPANHIIALVDEETSMDSVKFFKTVKKWKNIVGWYGSAKILVVVKTRDGQKVARFIFEELWRQVRAPNVVVYASEGTSGLFYTWDPYNPSCSIIVYEAGYWNSETSYEFSFFKSKSFKNLNKCTIAAAVATLEPYAIPDGSGNYTDGLEVRILQSLSTFYNFNYRFEKVPVGQIPMLNLINGTPAGLIGVLYRGEADISVSGAGLSYERRLYVDSVDPYFSDSLSWVGPTAQQSPKWKSVFLVFTSQVWYMIGVAFFLSVLAFYLIIQNNHEGLIFYQPNRLLYRRRVDNFQKIQTSQFFSTAFLVTCATQLNTSMGFSSAPVSLLFRFLRTFFFFYVLTVNALYSSGLYNFLFRGTSLLVFDSVDEAAEAGLSVLINPSIRKDLHRSLPDLYKFITQRNLVIWSTDKMPCLKRSAIYKDCFVLATGLSGQYMINEKFTDRAGKPYLRVFNKIWRLNPPSMYMGKHHPLLPAFRNSIRYLVEAGWITHEVNDILHAAFRRRSLTDDLLFLSENDGRKELSIEQVLGAFIVLTLFLCLALIVFLCELISYTRQWTRLKIFIYNKLALN